MNPYLRFKNYIIGDALSKTDDVFERARIEMVYSFTVFFILLGLVFYGNIFANGLWWQFHITTFGVITLPLVLVVLRKTKNVRYAGYFYTITQIFMSLSNQWLYKFEPNELGAFWQCVFLIFVFFVLGNKWGFWITLFNVGCILIKPIDVATGNKLLNYHVPPEQVPPVIPEFVLIPFLLIVFALYQIVKTREVAERQIRLQKLKLQENNKELETKNEDIISSINYAKRIQQAILPTEDNVQRGIPLSFILYKPRDIVSGDFYWFSEIDKDSYIIVAADCTGHGVPGAFMTVIGSNLLTQIINESKITEPSKILAELDKQITATLKQEKEHYQIIQDGMDLSLLKVNKTKKEFVYTSAKRPAIFIRKREIKEFKGSKNSLGGLRSGEKKFEEIRMNYEEDDMIYLFTDGYIDQFGGADNKKFMIKRLREKLLEVYQLPMPEQKQKLESAINSWIGKNEQTDDILVMGIRF